MERSHLTTHTQVEPMRGMGAELAQAATERAELDELLRTALRLGLTSPHACAMMRGHIEAGRFTVGHYLSLWRPRVMEASTESG